MSFRIMIFAFTAVLFYGWKLVWIYIENKQRFNNFKYRHGFVSAKERRNLQIYTWYNIIGLLLSIVVLIFSAIYYFLCSPR